MSCEVHMPDEQELEFILEHMMADADLSASSIRESKEPEQGDAPALSLEVGR